MRFTAINRMPEPCGFGSRQQLGSLQHSRSQILKPLKHKRSSFSLENQLRSAIFQTTPAAFDPMLVATRKVRVAQATRMLRPSGSRHSILLGMETRQLGSIPDLVCRIRIVEVRNEWQHSRRLCRRWTIDLWEGSTCRPVKYIIQQVDLSTICPQENLDKGSLNG
jgi:hypothetical protein